MDYFELVKKRRSIREFNNELIDSNTLSKILKCALLSPTSRNRRPWEFVVVNDKEKLEKISKCREHGSSFIADANIAIVIAADPQKCDVWIEDCSIAAFNIQLAAHSRGVGSCWVQVRKREYNHNVSTSDYIKEIVGVPKNYEVASVIALGIPKKIRNPYSDEDFENEKLHTNTYSNQYKVDKG